MIQKSTFRRKLGAEIFLFVFNTCLFKVTRMRYPLYPYYFCHCFCSLLLFPILKLNFLRYSLYPYCFCSLLPFPILEHNFCHYYSWIFFSFSNEWLASLLSMEFLFFYQFCILWISHCFGPFYLIEKNQFCF